MLNKGNYFSEKRNKERVNNLSLRRRLITYSITLTAVVVILLFVILHLTGYFSKDNEELKSLVQLQKSNTVTALDEHMNITEAKAISLSKQISTALNGFLISRDMEMKDLNDNGEMIYELEDQLAGILNYNLQSAKATGVYFVMDATCNTSLGKSDKACLYLRRADLDGNNLDGKSIYLFRGNSKVGHKYDFPIHNRWNLESDTSYMKGYETIMKSNVKRLAEHCFWTGPQKLKDTWENIIMLTVPVLGQDGEVSGVCGFEISEMYFRYCYPPKESRYGNINIIVAPVKNSKMILKSTLMEDRHSSEDEVSMMKIENYREYKRYKGKNGSYLGIHEILPVKMLNSENLALVVMVSEKSYKEAEHRNNRIRFVILVIFLIIVIAAIMIWLNHFIAPWSVLVGKIRRGEELRGYESGNSEIDRLMKYFDQKKNEESSAELPSDIEEMLEDFAARVKTLTPSEKAILNYYIEGFNLEEIADKTFISINTAKKHNTNINRKLGITNREELMLYIDIFRRCNKLDRISDTRESTRESTAGTSSET